MAVEENRANNLFAGLKDKSKEPNSVRVLNSWIDRVEQEVVVLGLPGRGLPVRVVAYPHWQIDYQDAAKSADIDLSLDEAVAITNEWLKQLGVAN